MALTVRQRNGAVLAGIFALAVAGFVKSGALAPAHRAVTVLGAVPADSFLVVTLNVPALRASPLADALTPMLGALDAGESKKACGFDPIDRVRTVAIALPEESTGDFGVVLRGTIEQEELVLCAKKTIAARGGSPAVSPDPAHPDFVHVKDGSTFASLTAPELAFGKDGLVLLGRGAWLEKMLAAASGASPSVLSGGAHMALRRALGGSDGGASDPRGALVTVVLPHALRDKLQGEMAEDGGLSGSMRGVFGVAAAGLALTAGDAGGQTEIAAQLRCDTAEACDEVDALLTKKRAAWSKEMAVRFLGLGPLVDGLAVEKHDTTISAHVAIPADDAGRIVAKLLAVRRGNFGPLGGGGGPTGGAGGGPSGSAATGGSEHRSDGGAGPSPRGFPALPPADDVLRPRR